MTIKIFLVTSFALVFAISLSAELPAEAADYFKEYDAVFLVEPGTEPAEREGRWKAKLIRVLKGEFDPALHAPELTFRGPAPKDKRVFIVIGLTERPRRSSKLQTPVRIAADGNLYVIGLSLGLSLESISDSPDPKLESEKSDTNPSDGSKSQNPPK